MNRTGKLLTAAAAGYIAFAGIEATVWAKADFVKKAKDLGYPATNCLYCHTIKLPKKDSFKPDQLNDRGKWLLAEKTKRQVKDVDVSWLKDYPGAKE